MINGAQAVVKCLEAEDISLLFGYPGVAIAPFYNSLLDSKSIKHILVRTEQNAGHAASGYARVSGKPAVCVATSGPGATNLITALATAYMDSIPLIAITGQVSSELLGRDVFQEVDITGSSEPFTKYSYLVKDANDIPRVFKEAFYIAATGRPGPVLIDIPIDIQQQEIPDFTYPSEVNIRGYKPTIKGHIVQVKKVAKAIKEANRPLLCLGGGVVLSHAEQKVRTFCETYQIPVVTTMMGLGILPTGHPLNFGMLGNNGKDYANKAVHNSDLLIIMGARLADRAVANPQSLEAHTPVIHIDVDPAEIGKNLGPTIPLVGDISHILDQLMETEKAGSYTDWIAQLTQWRTVSETIKRPDRENYVNPSSFIQMLSEKMKEDAIYVADVGQNQMWSARNIVMKNGRFLTTGGMGTMGYSLPAAMGAKAAAPDKQVIAVCGDGSIQMSLMELATLVQYQIPVKLVIMRNTYLGLVREFQHTSMNDRYIAVNLDGSPDFGLLAKAYGIPFIRLSNNAQMEEAITQFLQEDTSCILECNIYPLEGTFEDR